MGDSSALAAKRVAWAVDIFASLSVNSLGFKKAQRKAAQK